MDKMKKGKEKEKDPKIVNLGLLELIDKAESLVGSSTRFPLLKKAVVDVGKLKDVMKQLRDAVPKDIKKASQILEMREAIINQAHQEANRVRAVAEEAARRKVRESEIRKEAEKGAEEIKNEAQKLAEDLIAEAENEAALRRRDANQYTIEVLHELDEQLVTVINTVRNGIEKVHKEREEEAA